MRSAQNSIDRKEAFAIIILVLLAIALPVTVTLVANIQSTRSGAASSIEFKITSDSVNKDEIKETTNKAVRLRFTKADNWKVTASKPSPFSFSPVSIAYAQVNCSDQPAQVACPGRGAPVECQTQDHGDGQCTLTEEEKQGCLNAFSCNDGQNTPAPTETEQTCTQKTNTYECKNRDAVLCQRVWRDNVCLEPTGQDLEACLQQQGCDPKATSTPAPNPTDDKCPGGRIEDKKCYDGIANVTKDRCNKPDEKWFEKRDQFSNGCYRLRAGQTTNSDVTIKKLIIKNTDNGTGGSAEKEITKKDELKDAFNIDKGIKWNLNDLASDKIKEDRKIQVTVFFVKDSQEDSIKITKTIKLTKTATTPTSSPSAAPKTSPTPNNTSGSTSGGGSSAGNNSQSGGSNSGSGASSESNSSGNTGSGPNSTSNKNSTGSAKTGNNSSNLLNNPNQVQASHLECINNACTQVTGAGSNTCSSSGVSCTNSATGTPQVTLKTSVPTTCSQKTFSVKAKGSDNKVFDVTKMNGISISTTNSNLQLGKTYDLLVSAESYLAKKITAVTIGQTSTVDFGQLIAGDVNPKEGDGVINAADVNSLVTEISKVKEQDLRFDLNCDGQVEVIDYSIMIKNLLATADKL